MPTMLDNTVKHTSSLGEATSASGNNARRWWRHLTSPLPWLVLVLFTALTLIAALLNSRSTQELNEERFAKMVDELAASIEDRLAAYRLVLYGFSGLVAIEGKVDRENWQALYASFELDKFYPGIQGVGFARLVNKDDWQDYERQMQASGFENFKITPVPQGDVISAIEILEPSDWRNQRTIRYDMYSDSVRREAMQRSRGDGDIAISGVVTLLQETQDDVQPGFLMYLAYFKKPLPSEPNTELSDKELLGWVYAPFRIRDFVDGVLHSQHSELAFQLFDESVTKENLMYSSTKTVGVNARYKIERIIEFGHREWRIVATSLPEFELHNDNRLSLFILLAGLLECATLFILALLFVATRHNARVQESLLVDKHSSEQRIAEILNATTTALITTDSEGNILEANTQAAELFGYARQTLLSMKVEALVPNEDREKHKMYRRKYNQDPYRREMGTEKELYAQNVRGELIPVEIGLSPIKSESGTQVLASIVDIRERLKDKRERERILEQLSAKNVEMEQFVYTVSHDLKSPLVTINGFTKLLSDSLQDKLDEKQTHWLDRITANVHSMEGLLNDLLELSRIIHRTLELEEVDLEDVCTDVVSTLSQQIRETGAIITRELTVAKVFAHKRLVVQCLQNLMSNAMQYRKPGEQCEIHVSSYEEGDWTVVSVQDNGIGIAPTHQARIFEIFERLSAKSSSGTGVGLAVVKTAMEKHGGYVQVKSELGEGSDFLLFFPRA